MENAEKYQCAVCIPIYKPQHDFIEGLKGFKNTNSVEFIFYILETVDSQKDLESSDIRFLKHLEVNNLHYTKILKKDFHHATARNSLIKQIPKCDFVLFTTQDTYHQDISEKLSVVIDEMNEFKTDAVSFRHESPNTNMNAVFDNIFKGIDYETYLSGPPSQIAWWSNNFAIYTNEVMNEIPFPEDISWAEDLAWAKLARLMGRKLRIETRFAVLHLNDDSYKSAYQRGKDNGKGFLEIYAKFFEFWPQPTWKIDLIRSAAGMYKLELRRAIWEKRFVKSFFPIINSLLIWSFQAFGRIREFKGKERKYLWLHS